MAPQMSAADNTLITELPATLAGLWTAITTMHDTVMTVADDVGPCGLRASCFTDADALGEPGVVLVFGHSVYSLGGGIECPSSVVDRRRLHCRDGRGANRLRRAVRPARW